MAHSTSPASSASLTSRLAGKPQVSPSLRILDSSSLSEMNLNLSVASEEPSQNTPLTSQSVSDMTVLQLPACQADFNASLSQDKAPSSPPQQMLSFTSPSSLPSPSSHCTSPASSASQKSRISDESSSIPIIPNVSPNSSVVKEGPAMVKVIAVGSVKKEAGRSVPKRKFSVSYCLQDSKIDNEAASKPKDIKLDTNLNKNPDDSDGQFLPGAVGRYDRFLEDVYPDKDVFSVEMGKYSFMVILGDTSKLFMNLLWLVRFVTRS